MSARETCTPRGASRNSGSDNTWIPWAPREPPSSSDQRSRLVTHEGVGGCRSGTCTTNPQREPTWGNGGGLRVSTKALPAGPTSISRMAQMGAFVLEAARAPHAIHFLGCMGWRIPGRQLNRATATRAERGSDDHSTGARRFVLRGGIRGDPWGGLLEQHRGSCCGPGCPGCYGRTCRDAEGNHAVGG